MNSFQQTSSASTKVDDKPLTWIKAYPGISGKEFSIDVVMKRIGDISLEEEREMNSAINDSVMTPITLFERKLFEIIDADTGELSSPDSVQVLLDFIKDDHSLVERMLILESISRMRKSRNLRHLYKCGLLDIFRLWLSPSTDPGTDALIECTLTFLHEGWITRALINNYSFGIGKAIVKIKKSDNKDNSALAEAVQKHWTDILQEEKKEEAVVKQEIVPIPVMISQGRVSLPGMSSVNIQTMSRGYMPTSSISQDGVALNTRSRRPHVDEDEIDLFKHARLTSHDDISTRLDDGEDKSKMLWEVRSRRVDKRSKFLIKRHQTNERCNCKLTIKLDYYNDIAFIKTPKTDLFLSDGRIPLVCNNYFLDYVALYAGSFSKNINQFASIDIPDLPTLHESIRGKTVSGKDVMRALDYLDTGVCGKVVKI